MKANMTRLYRVIKVLFSRLLLWVYGIKVIGAENEPRPEDGGYLLCANHLGALDPFCIAAALWNHQLHFMAKQELFKHKLPAAFFRALGAYPVDRRGADVHAIRNSIRMLQGGKCIAMFPQGTRCPGQHPRETRIKPGAGMLAARAQVPVLPVLITSGDWKVGPFHRGTRIVIGKPIPPQEYMPAEGEQVSYGEVSRIIFEHVCALEDQV